MKKFTLLLIFILVIFNAYSQWCVKTYPTGGTPITTFESNISVLEIAPNGDLWFNMIYGSGQGFGLGKFNGIEWASFYAESDIDKLSPVVNAVDFDLNNNVWVATDGGLARFDGISQRGWELYYKTNSPLTDNKVTALKIDATNIKWIGLANGDIINIDKDIWSNYSMYRSQGIIRDIETGADGSVWIAKDGKPGVIRYKDSIWTPFDQFSEIHYITSDQSGRTFVPSGDSLTVIFDDKIINITKADPGLSLTLFDVVVGPNGSVWVSSSKGLLLKAGDFFRRYNQNNSPIPLLFSPVPLEFDPEGNLWFSYYYTDPVKNSFPGLGYLYKSIVVATPIALVNKPKPEFCFGDSIILSASADANGYIWSDGTVGKTTVIRDNALINLAYAGANNCYYYDTIPVIAQHVFENEVPCVVTVSPEYKNLLVWERTRDVGTASYNIYKETMTDSFTFLGNLPAGQLSVFEDSLSDPRKKSAKYKIASVDTCGNESGPSFYHKTMHLQLSYGLDTTEINLAWQNYEGFWFPYYIIYKGTNPDSLYPVDSIPWDDNNLTWTDYNVIGHYYYRVGVQLPFVCAPAGSGKKADSGPYSHSMSQIEDNRFQTFIDEKGITEILSYPNPFSNWTQIDFENPTKYPYQLKVTDMSGKIVRMVNNIRDDKVILLRENLPQGFYLFELKGEKIYRGKFVVK
jgi:hypothetical protein